MFHFSLHLGIECILNKFYTHEKENDNISEEVQNEIQLVKVINIFGMPDKENILYPYMKKYESKCNPDCKIKFDQLKISPSLLDLLQKMLCYDYTKPYSRL